jgi:hypothetical protein
MATLGEVTKILMWLSAKYAHAPQLTEHTFRSYHQTLSELPYELLQTAADQLGSETKFLPSAGELYQTAFQLMEWADEIPDAYTAWGEVNRAISTRGFYRGAPEWSHPLIGEALRKVGGFAQLCLSGNEAADRSQFINAYATLLARHRQQVRMAPRVRATIRQLASGSAVTGKIAAAASPGADGQSVGSGDPPRARQRH